MKLPVLSHTFLSNYENCPRKAWHIYVAKDLPFSPPTPEMEAGIARHRELEAELLASNSDGPHAKYVAPILQMAQDCIPHYEWAVAIAETGTPVDYWSDLAWFRGKLDVALVAPPHAMIVDWKTGKPREDTAELERFAVLLQAHYPHCESIVGSYVWLKTDEMGPMHDLGNTARTLQHLHWLDDSLKRRPLETEWEATPSGLCPWCPVKSCPHWRERK